MQIAFAKERYFCRGLFQRSRHFRETDSATHTVNNSATEGSFAKSKTQVAFAKEPSFRTGLFRRNPDKVEKHTLQHNLQHELQHALQHALQNALHHMSPDNVEKHTLQHTL